MKSFVFALLSVLSRIFLISSIFFIGTLTVKFASSHIRVDPLPEALNVRMLYSNSKSPVDVVRVVYLCHQTDALVFYPHGLPTLVQTRDGNLMTLDAFLSAMDLEGQLDVEDSLRSAQTQRALANLPPSIYFKATR